jgi:hypothetical protein
MTRKTAAKTAAVAKRAQPHGGALLEGGVPGNAGGTGRPPSAIRETARLMFDERLPKLANIADGRSKKVRTGDRLRAIELLGKIGLDDAAGIDVVHPEVIMRVQNTRKLIASRPTWDSEELLTALHEVWK